jgi:hypothetical protein
MTLAFRLDLALAPAEVCELVEPFVVTDALHSGVRLIVVGDDARLLFYSERPDAQGRIEFVVTARLVAPLSRARTTIARLAALAGPDVPAPAFAAMGGRAN